MGRLTIKELQDQTVALMSNHAEEMRVQKEEKEKKALLASQRGHDVDRLTTEIKDLNSTLDARATKLGQIKYAIETVRALRYPGEDLTLQEDLWDDRDKVIRKLKPETNELRFLRLLYSYCQ